MSTHRFLLTILFIFQLPVFNIKVEVGSYIKNMKVYRVSKSQAPKKSRSRKVHGTRNNYNGEFVPYKVVIMGAVLIIQKATTMSGQEFLRKPRESRPIPKRKSVGVEATLLYIRYL